jgi:hypothetical protein
LTVASILVSDNAARGFSRVAVSLFLCRFRAFPARRFLVFYVLYNKMVEKLHKEIRAEIHENEKFER